MTNYVSLLATLPPVRRAWQRLACSSSLSEESHWIINDNGKNVIDCKLSKIVCKQGDGPDFDNFHIIGVFIISTNVCMNVLILLNICSVSDTPLAFLIKNHPLLTSLYFSTSRKDVTQ